MTDDDKAAVCVEAFKPLAALDDGLPPYPVINGIEYRRAELGVDGNAAFALLGPNVQEGEAEFVTVEQIGDELLSISERRAARKALCKLRERLKMPHLSYYIGSSHPGYC